MYTGAVLYELEDMKDTELCDQSAGYLFLSVDLAENNQEITFWESFTKIACIMMTLTC